MNGASVTLNDPRVSKVIGWVWVTLGALLVTSLLWVAKSINELNSTVTTLVTQNQAVFERLAASERKNERQDDQLVELRSDVSILQGRSLRGNRESTP